MALNGLGFTNRPLYLTPQFFASKAVETLLGPGIEARHLNDDALGDTLDRIGDYDPSKLFGEVAHEVAVDEDLLSGPLHVDTTSFSVVGEYAIDGEAGDGQANQPQVIKLTHGFSKDHRPDLKQAVLSLAVPGCPYG
jgi:transposase